MTYEQALSTFIIEEGLAPPLRREQKRLFQKGFQAGAASRDAEIQRLKTVPMKYRRMAFNAQLQDENAKLNQQLAAEQAKNVGMREALEYSIKQVPELATVPGISKAISTQSDTSALEAIVKKAGEVMRERCAVKADWFTPFVGGKIRTLPVVTLEDLK